MITSSSDKKQSSNQTSSKSNMYLAVKKIKDFPHKRMSLQQVPSCIAIVTFAIK